MFFTIFYYLETFFDQPWSSSGLYQNYVNPVSLNLVSNLLHFCGTCCLPYSITANGYRRL